MIINDKRNKSREISWADLKFGEVYISNRLQKYMMYTQEYKTIDLDSGEMFDEDEHFGDVFYPVKATLEIE